MSFRSERDGYLFRIAPIDSFPPDIASVRILFNKMSKLMLPVDITLPPKP